MAYSWGGLVDIINKLLPSVEIFITEYTRMLCVYGKAKLYLWNLNKNNYICRWKSASAGGFCENNYVKRVISIN